jgi:NTE family protein
MNDLAANSAAPSGSEAKASLRPQVGIVLGSGGSKGIVHIPILEALTRWGIPIDLITGASIGAVIAGVYAAGALETFRKDLRKMKREDFLRVFDPSLSRGGLFSGRKAVIFLHRYIPRQSRIEDLPIPLGIVATDYDTGCPIILRQGNLLDAIRASFSIPGIFMPARVGRDLLIDGGVANPLPIDVALEMGADLTIAVSLKPAIGKLGLNFPPAIWRSKTGREPKPDHLPVGIRLFHRWAANGREAEADQPGTSSLRRPIPNLFEVLARTIDIMEDTETKQMLASHPPTVLLEFDVPDVGVLDFTHSPALLEEGRRVLESKKAELIEKIRDPLVAAGRTPIIRTGR